jgi:hypothetical protein
MIDTRLVIGAVSRSYVDDQGEQKQYNSIHTLVPLVSDGEAGFTQDDIRCNAAQAGEVLAFLAKQGPSVVDLDVSLVKMGRSTVLRLNAIKAVGSNKFLLTPGGLKTA